MEKHFVKRFIDIVSVAMLSAFLLASGCAGTANQRTTAVDKQYQRVLEQQRRKAALSDEVDIEKKLPPANDPGILERIGDVYAGQGNHAMAFIEYNKALQISPDRTSARLKSAYLMLKRAMSAEAASEFDKVLKQSPENVEALQGKAVALLQLNRLNEAEAVIKAAIKKNAGLWQAYALLGSVYDRQKLYKSAIESYRRAIAINPKAATIYNDLGVACYMSGQ